MIIVQMMGGLGNQMFQYAMARNLAYDRQEQLRFDLSWYSSNAQRNFQLDNFNITAQAAPEEEIELLVKKKHKDLFYIGSYLIHPFLFYSHCKFVQERCFNYDSRIKYVPRQVYLSGYWQSEKYFKHITPLLKKEFILKENLHPLNQNYLNQIQSSIHSISLHIRRGDYISDPKTSSIYSKCDLSYYQSAFHLIQKRKNNSHIFVFSDDQIWAKNNLQFENARTTFVENETNQRDFEVIYLISQCENHIIANSSFSWWGAWLSENRDKIVIAPKRWFKGKGQNTRDLIPEEWIKL